MTSSILDDVWGGAKGILGVVAPLLATAVGGPLAGAATRAICGALGLDEASTPTQVAAAVQAATPDQLAALKQADAQFKEQMAAIQVSEEKLGFDDRANARQMMVSSLQANRGDVTPQVLAIGVTVGLFTLLGIMAFVKVPAENAAVLNIMVGALSAGFTGVLGFYFGSSAGSRQKDDTIATQAKGASANAPLALGSNQ